jgi:DNA-binding GntR family transcriptional regulator
VFDHLSIDRDTTTDRVARALRREVFLGNLMPGTPLGEIEVSKSLGVSRNTVREAAQQLEFEGLLSRQANRRIVTVPTAEDVADIYRVRLLLEIGGIEASTNATPSELGTLETAFQRFARAVRDEDAFAVVERHIDFHAATVAFMRSARLDATYRAAMVQLRLAFVITDRDHDDLNEQIATHQEILEHVQNARIAQCVAELRRNYSKAEREVLESLGVYHANGSSRVRGTRDRGKV